MRAIQQEERVRLARIDCLRIAATLEVLSFHCLRNSADHGGTSVLMILAVMLAAETRPGREWKEVLVKRAQRLLLPFLVWSGFYALVRIFRAFFSARPLKELFDPWMLLAGTEVHLWFLPPCFLFTGIVGVLATKNRFQLRCLAHCVAWAVVAAIMILLCSWMIQFFPEESFMPFFGWVKVLPSVFVGLSLATLPKESTKRTAGLTLLLLLVLVASLSAWVSGLRLLTAPQSLGVVACTLTWAMKEGAVEFLTRLGILTYGVYLMHFFPYFVFNKLLHVQRGFLLLVLVAISSFLLAEVLRRTPVRRFI